MFSLILLAALAADPLTPAEMADDLEVDHTMVYVDKVELNDVYEWGSDGVSLKHKKSLIVLWRGDDIAGFISSPDSLGVLIQDHRMTFRNKGFEVSDKIFIFDTFENTNSFNIDSLQINKWLWDERCNLR